MKTVKRRKKTARSLFILIVVIVAAALLWHPVYENVFLKTAYPEKYSDLVFKYSRETDLDPDFVFSVIRNESSFNKDALSGVGARGLMQITPETFEWAMSKLSEQGKYTDDDLYTPEVNVRYGTYILSSLKKEFDDERTVVAAYHAGRSNIKKWLLNSEYSKDGKTLIKIPFKDTSTYVDRVEKAKGIYKELYG